jgi:hypothetical protein
MSFYSKRLNEGGSLGAFLVIGLVLAVLVVGGVYLVSRPAQSPQSTPVATKKPSPSKSVAVSKAPQPSPTKSKAPSSGSHGPIAKAPPKTAAPLPATGPTEDMVSISMLGILVGFMIAYVRSTREWRLLHQVD